VKFPDDFTPAQIKQDDSENVLWQALVLLHKLVVIG
jgi:hypothetical protein